MEDFIHRVTSLTTDRTVDQGWLITVIMNGLKPNLSAKVIKADPQTLEDLTNVAARAEMAELRRTTTPALQESTNLALLNDLQEIREDLRANPKHAPHQQPNRRPGKQGLPNHGYHSVHPQSYQPTTWFQHPPFQWQQPHTTGNWQQPQWHQAQPSPGPRPGPNRPAQSYHMKGEFCDSVHNNVSSDKCFYCR